ncbi:b63ea512-b4e2-4d92-ab0a-1635c95be0d4 [Thermothielavioides terrestris]|uniref:Uncharacterized protein n=2 Tax=Thermothielavioides terrestris TaxID=2587410 RepID=G2QZ45_THETT|nr:uncharacterized protein THITE_2112522 [Thermothielavioides terrestris NRRL 8126]AEO65477.1 hypothetical protein THITE_2112522 [Thermothielavioides terrestris NRRL 8126]SPQ19269.1 b63ea512-b4e2-4d92-ab0a-1635c95be0d4 [Thermothielavioides terrestris]
MSAKPTLRVSTPLTANFPHIPPTPSELRSAASLPSAVSTTTPLSAVSRSSAFRDPIRSSGLPSAGLPSAGPFSATIKLEHDLQKTPITPPVAYLDFLKGMSLASPSIASPPQTGRSMLNRTSTASSTRSNDSSTTNASTEPDDSEKEKGEQIESAPTTARSELSCEGEEDKDKDKDKEKEKEKDQDKARNPKPASTETKRPISPRSSNCPMSAPPVGPTVFPSMKLPASPAISASGLYSPRSPLSAASVKSPFDWEAALRARRFAETPGSKRPAAPDTPGIPAAAAATPGTAGQTKRDSRSSIRHIREVVTRTVTYTPRMGPAPKGKRRKIDPEETGVKS